MLPLRTPAPLYAQNSSHCFNRAGLPMPQAGGTEPRSFGVAR